MLGRNTGQSVAGPEFQNEPAAQLSLGRLFTYNLSYGPIAQLVEQRTFNPWVEGSSPSGPTFVGSGELHSPDPTNLTPRGLGPSTQSRAGSDRREHEPARYSAEALKNGTDVPF